MTLKKEDEVKDIHFRYNLNLYWELLRKYKLLFFSLLFLVLLGEGLSVAEKYLFKILVDKSTDFSNNILSSEMFISALVIVALIFAFVSIIRIINTWFHIHIINRLDGNLILELKRKFFNHLIYLSHSFHVSHKTGSMISRLSRGGRAMERMTDTIVFNFAPLIFQFLVVSVSLAFLDINSAVIIFSTIIVFLAYNFINQKLQQKSSVLANDAEDIEKANIGDIFTNIDAIKYFGKEKVIQNRFKNLTDNTKKAMIKNWNYFRWSDSGQRLILSLGTFFLLYFSIKNFLAGQLTVGTLVFIYTLYLSLMGPLYSFTHGMRDIYRVMADFESLFQYARIEQEIKDSKDSVNAEIKNGEIFFKNISFNYGKRSILKNLDLKIRKNQKIALVGHSGCGKTTLVKLLYRFYDVKSGEILIDGKNIKEFKQESLRNEMSIVPQECVLFDDTIYNNIAFSNPQASRKEVLKAIKFSQLDKIIESFPNKEKTIVGERGIKLSGGEKQRVSIARAILGDKKILVLDEATSSLDSETEHEIQKDLAKLMKGRTSIIIAHRLSTIMNADVIVVMKKGKIIQMGSHRELITEGGEYQRLWDFQRGGYVTEKFEHEEDDEEGEE